ncbi:Kinesin-like protein 6 [Fulvia fulva]|nr:Kinesin-like protein 6 [Fulvia fulva]KAK4627444.1 Kinesin-like protein 6 [Fulvia fulva]WPV14122.1 Kinesin-like protein 6 [Fulvia fulva]WPV29176.1 Kinesin-like protein 6 [Fulvia fulva]
MAAAATDGASTIQVAVRVRPFTIQEAAQVQRNDDTPLFLGDGSLAAAPKARSGKGMRNVIKVLDDKTLIFDPPEDGQIQRLSRHTSITTGKRSKDQTFGFDRVLDEHTSQAEVYDQTTRGLLDSVLDGFNCTVFAYGATGCGKTHTITGSSQEPGIIFMTMQELFERIEDLKDMKTCEVSLSYLEIYNERIRDLLSDDPEKQDLSLQENSEQDVVVDKLSTHKPENVKEVMDMVVQGNSKRTQSPTEANATSSRSHAVLQVAVTLKDRDATTGETVSESVTCSTLRIIDLAGSERASATKNRGARLTEGANINKSLLALGSCINALCDRRIKHIPYRNSKLTRLLKFSLGGNCRTVMIVCISPCSVHFDETQNTLRYANRAKNIQTKSVRNVFSVDRHVKDYVVKINEQVQRINELTAQLKEHESSSYTKFNKAASKKVEILREGIRRIRNAYDHSSPERQDRIKTMQQLRLVERRISAISGWVGAFDQVCEARGDEDPPAALMTVRKTAQGILLELETSRQHCHQRLIKNNWTRAIETALQDVIGKLHNLDGAVAESPEEQSLCKEVEMMKSSAEIDCHLAVIEQEKVGEAGLMRVMLLAHFETIAIIGQIMQMSEDEAVQAAKEVLGKVLMSCTEATGQVVKPDGSLHITEAVPPRRSGTPRKAKATALMGPSPTKFKIRQSLSAAPAPSAIPAHTAAELQPSPDVGMSPVRGPMSSPRKRVRVGGMARKPFSSGTPRKKLSPTKKRVVKWKDEGEEGASLVEYQPTPKLANSTPPMPMMADSDREEPPVPNLSYDADGEIMSSPLPALPMSRNPPTSTRSPTPSSMARKSVSSRFANGFLSKKADGSPMMPPPGLNNATNRPTAISGSYSSDEESSPLREMNGNRAPHTLPSPDDSSPPLAPPTLNAEQVQDTSEIHSDLENNTFSDKEAAQQIRSAMHKGKRHSRSSVGGGIPTRQRSTRESIARRRSPTAATSPSSDSNTVFSASHARRFVTSHRDDSSRSSILSPRVQPITKGTLPLTARRSMFDLGGTPRDTPPVNRPTSRVSSVLPGSAVRPNSKAAWR